MRKRFLPVTILFACAVAFAQAPDHTSQSPANAQQDADTRPANESRAPDANAPTKVYKVGRGVSPPIALETPSPVDQEQAKKAKYQGTVLLWVVVNIEGTVKDVKIVRSLDRDLDKKAVEAVRKWRFKPAMKDGHPVAVGVNVEVNFKLY